ncbi:MAG: MFS transporter [Halodesulfurarchaeum sp.]
MTRPSLDSVRGFDRAVYAVAVGQLLNVFGSGLVYPFATVHFHLRVGIALSIVGLGFLAKNVTTAGATALGGYVADSRGRKPVMVASMAGNAVTLAAFAFVSPIAAAVGPVTPGMAFVGVAAASGATAGLYTPAAQAYTADLTRGDARDQAFSLLKVANNVGFGTGFVVGGLLYELASVAIFIADGATSGVVAVLLLLAIPRVMPEAMGDQESDSDTSATDREGSSADRESARGGPWRRVLTNRRVLHLAALNIGFAVMYAQMRTTIPIVAEERVGLDPAQLGTLFVLNPVTLVVLQLPLVAAVSSWRRTRGLMLSAGFWAVAMLLIAVVYLVPSPSLLVGIILVGGHLVIRTIGEVLHSPIATSVMSALGGATERGSSLSVLEIAKRLGFGIGSFVGGLFFDLGVPHLLWPVLAVACLLLVVGLRSLEADLTPAENGVRADVVEG